MLTYSIDSNTVVEEMVRLMIFLFPLLISGVLGTPEIKLFFRIPNYSDLGTDKPLKTVYQEAVSSQGFNRASFRLVVSHRPNDTVLQAYIEGISLNDATPGWMPQWVNIKGKLSLINDDSKKEVAIPIQKTFYKFLTITPKFTFLPRQEILDEKNGFYIKKRDAIEFELSISELS